MRVAIIGAGISGLACAIGLERHGIKPVIFDKRAHIGEAINYSTIWPRIINRPITDPLKYLKKEYALELTPLSRIKKMVMYSPDHRAVERGSLGYIFKRGYPGNSLEVQLLNHVTSPVTFNTYIELKNIRNEFDYIVVSNATNDIAKELGVWTETFNAHARIAVILGRFKPAEITMWLDTSYGKNGFCYLIPINDKEASLVQIVNGITGNELEYYWNQFLSKENINYSIVMTTDAEHDCGFVRPAQTGNVLFAGNAGGFTDDLIGCGSLNAIESGILAAHAIAHGKDYSVLSKPIFDDIVKLHELRKAMNTFDNTKINLVVKALGFPILKNALYNNPFFKFTGLSKSARLYNFLFKSGRRAAR